MAKKSRAKKTALVSAFADVPDAKGMMAGYGVPTKLAKRGFFVVREGHMEWLFKAHPESKLPARAAGGGMMLIEAVLDQETARERVGGACEIGFHADLDAPALKKVFEDEGFRVEPAPLSKLAAIAYSDTDPWPAATALLKSDELEVQALLDALYTHHELAPPPDKFMSLVATKLETRDDVQKLRLVLGSAKADLTACAIPLVTRLWKPKKAKAKPRGLPPELTTLLSAVDGIPALVLSPSKIAERTAYLRNLTKNIKGVGKRDWGDYSPKEIRIDRMWRDGWIPFCVRPNDEMVAIDLEPTGKGVKGQVIGVHLNPPTLTRYRATFGEWLWNELEGSWR